MGAPWGGADGCCLFLVQGLYDGLALAHHQHAMEVHALRAGHPGWTSRRAWMEVLSLASWRIVLELEKRVKQLHILES